MTATAAQLTQEWRNSRLGLVTASRADQLVTQKTGKVSASAKALGHKLAMERFTGEPISETGSTWAMERGIEREPETRARYEFERNATVTESGFIKHPELEIGCSPDGLIAANGGLEIKNPLQPTYAKCAMHVHELKTVPFDYAAQCLFSLIVTDREWWDCVVDYPGMPLVVARMTRDKKAEALMLDGVAACLEARDKAIEVFQSLGQVQEAA